MVVTAVFLVLILAYTAWLILKLAGRITDDGEVEIKVKFNAVEVRYVVVKKGDRSANEVEPPERGGDTK